MSSIQTIVEDAQKIASELIPPGGVLAEAVGVLTKQVEKLAGAELTSLTDAELGKAAPPAADQAAGAEPAKTIPELEAELDAAKRAQAAAGA